MCCMFSSLDWRSSFVPTFGSKFETFCGGSSNSEYISMHVRDVFAIKLFIVNIGRE